MIRLRGERDASRHMLVPTGLGKIYSDMMQQRDRAERVVREVGYYRGLYHGAVPTAQREASYTESVRFHRT